MNNGTSSSNSSDNDEQNGDSHNPDAVPPDLDSAKQKARERGHWLREAIIKGGMSGAVRAILEEGMNNLL